MNAVFKSVSSAATTDRSRSAGLTRIVFWEPCVSPHKSAFISAVAERFGPDVTVYCVAHEGVPQARQALGWTDSSELLHHTVVAPDDALIDALIDEGGQTCLHVFSGIRWFSTLTRALARVKRQGRRFALMSEPRDNAGWKGALRFIQSYLTEAWLRRHVQFVLAIGRHGSPWFRSVGYAAERVFPFAYFLPPPSDDGLPDGMSLRTGDSIVQVAYVGRFTEAKGVRFVLPALAKLTTPARITLIGDGELRPQLEQQALDLQLDMVFTGPLPIGEVQRRMRDFDILILPSISRDDGWGAVVSEALLAGVAVIASECAGASILLDQGADSSNGCVVPPADSAAIAAAITTLQRDGWLAAHARKARKQWAVERLTAQAGALHFEHIVRHRIEGAARPKEFFL